MFRGNETRSQLILRPPDLELPFHGVVPDPSGSLLRGVLVPRREKAFRLPLVTFGHCLSDAFLLIGFKSILLRYDFH